jgi:ubiquinone/menaquinone biosynthesis C-methylase UbiE
MAQAAAPRPGDNHFDGPLGLLAGLAELHRVLAPSGRLLLVERLARPRSWFSHHALTWERAEQLAARAATAGFIEPVAERVALGRSRLALVRARHPG